MVRKFYGGNPHATTSDELELVQKLAKNDEKELLALILIQLGRLNGHLAQIEGRLSEPSFMETRSEGLPLEVIEHDPDVTKSGFDLVLSELRNINAQLEFIGERGLKSK